MQLWGSTVATSVSTWAARLCVVWVWGGGVWKYDVSLGLNEQSSVVKLWKSWFCHVSQRLLFALPPPEHLPSFNPPCSVSKSTFSQSCLLFLSHLSSFDVFPPCVVSLFIFICLPNHLIVMISITSLSINSLSHSVYVNNTICWSAIPLFSLIWWLNIYTHIALIE